MTSTSNIQQTSPPSSDEAIEKLRHYLDRFEAECASPAMSMFWQAYSMNPLISMFLAFFIGLSLVPIIAITIVSACISVFIACVAVGAGIILISALQIILVLVLSTTILLAALLAGMLTGLSAAISCVIAIASPFFNVVGGILSWSAVAFLENALGWQSMIVRQLSAVKGHLAQVHFWILSSNAIQALKPVSWGRCWALTVTGFRITASVVYVGVSIAQLVSGLLEITCAMVKTVFICLGMITTLLWKILSSLLAARTRVSRSREVPANKNLEDHVSGVSTSVSLNYSS